MAEPAGIRPVLVQAGDQPGRVFTDRFTVGRAGCGADIELDDDYVSSRHAAFWPDPPEGWYVEDLGSTNGVSLMPGTGRLVCRQRLRKGDKVRIGRTIITVVPA